MADNKHFNPNVIFGWLFLFTFLEVTFGVAFHSMNRIFLWSGLGFFAFLKGWLIMVYFMHLKFEGWVVKSLLVPTLFLMGVIWGYVSPDITRSQYLDQPIGSMYDSATGQIVTDLRHWDPKPEEAEGEHGGASEE